MKKKIFTTQQIVLVALFIGLSSAAAPGSCGCRPEELARDRDSEIAKITMESLEIIGYMNGAPVVQVEGNITEKHIAETSKLCLLVMPKGKNVEEEIKKFQKRKQDSNQELGYGNEEVSYILLDKDDKSKGAVYYLKDVPASVEGGIQEASAFIGGQLPEEEYEAYLLLDTITFGTVFDSIPQPLKILPATGPSITMGTPQAGRDTTTQNTKIFAEATINNVTDFAGMKGWFLFIKKGATTNAETVIVDLLKSGKKEFSADPKFTLVANGKAIAHPFANPVMANNTIDAVDNDPTKKLFEKGATYTVYAFFLGASKVAGPPSYTISDSKDVTILKPEVELEIKEVKITELIKCLDLAPATNGDELSIKYEAEITKNLGTFKPQIGLLFAKGAAVDNEGGRQKIQSSLANKLIGQYYQDGGDIVYLIGQDISKLGDTVTTPDVPLELGQTYHVHFFLQDGEGKGDVFLSKNDVSLTVPKASLEIKEFYTRKIAETFRVVMDQAVTDIVFSDGHDPVQQMIGYGIFDPGATDYRDVGLWRDVLQNIDRIPTTKEPKKKGYAATLAHGQQVFLMDMTTINTKPADAYPYDKRTTDNKSYDVVLFVACENAVFYQAATDPSHKFIWHNPVKPDETVQFVDYNDGSGEKKYELLWNGPSFAHAKIQIPRPDGKGVDFIFNDAGNEVLIKGILAKIIVGGPQDKIDEDIKRFMDNMQKHP